MCGTIGLFCGQKSAALGGIFLKTIITIQHTQSVHHTNGMVGSWTDWDLTEKGILQARRIGEKLKIELSGKPPVLYTSDLKRAAQTAAQIAACLELTPIARTELRERNLGKCCGKSVQWLRENMECSEQTVDDRLFSDAESRRDEWNRLKPLFDEILSCPAETVLIVSHGDLLSVFHAMFLGLEVESLNTCELFGMAGGVSWLQIRDDGKRFIRRLGDLSYTAE